MIHLPIIAIAFVLALAVRSYWVSFQLEQYDLVCLHYITMCNLDEEAARELYELWPRSYLYWEWWHWDFSRYVVNTERYGLMMDWIASQLARQDLSIDTFRRELAKVEERDAADRLAAFQASQPSEEPPSL